MANIYVHKDYNAAIGDNVGYLKVPSYKDRPNSGPEYVKAFRITDNIWLVPERYQYGEEPASLAIPSKATNSTDYYDPEYLKGAAKKNIWLKQMTKVFQRLQENPVGEKLLDMINNSTPMSRDNPTNYIRSNSVTIYDSNKTKLKSYAASVIIYGPGKYVNRHMTMACGSLSKTSKIEDFHGYMTEMLFAPDILQTFPTKKEGLDADYHLFDPAITLAHELTHSLRMNYGIHQYVKGIQLYTALEELVALDSEALRSASRNQLQERKAEYRDMYKNVISNKLNSLYNSPDREIFERYKNKYFAKVRDNKVVLDDESFNRLYSLLVYELNEKKISEIFQQLRQQKTNISDLLIRQYYTAASDYVFQCNLLDNDVYDKKSGLSQYLAVKRSNVVLPDKYVRVITGSGKYSACASTSKSKRDIGNCVSVDEDIYDPIDEETGSGQSINITVSTGPIKQSEDEPVIIDWKTIDIPINNPFAITAEDTPMDEMEVIPPVKEANVIESEDYSIYHTIAANDIKQADPSKPTKVLDMNNENIGKALEDKNTKLNLFPDVKNAMGTVDTVTNVTGTFLWANSVYHAYKTGTTKDVIEAGVSIVPFVGPLINFAKGNFVDAFKEAATQTLYTALPELVIPSVVVSFLWNKIFKRSTDSDGFEYDDYLDVLANIQHDKDEFISSICLYYIEQWKKRNVASGSNLKKALNKSLLQQNDLILHQMKEKLDKLEYDGIIDKDIVGTILEHAAPELNNSSDLGMSKINKMINRATIDSFFESSDLNPFITAINASVKKIKEDIHTNFMEHVNDNSNLFDDDRKKLKDNLENILKEYDKEISVDPKELEYHLFNNESDTVHEAVMDIGPHSMTYPVLNEADLKTSFYDRFNPDTVVEMDGSGAYEFIEGRKSYCLNLMNHPSATPSNADVAIKSKLLTALTSDSDYNISVWVRVPLLNKISSKEFSQIPIMEFNINRPDKFWDTGLYLILNYGCPFLSWKQDNEKHEIVNNTFIGSDKIIADNSWHLLQFGIVDKKLSLSVDGVLIESKLIPGDVSPLYPMENKISFGILTAMSPINIMFSNIRVYTGDIIPKPEEVLSHDMNNGQYIYDYWGNSLKNNKKYHLAPLSLAGLTSYLVPADVDYKLLTREIQDVIPYNYGETRFWDVYAGVSVTPNQSDVESGAAIFNNDVFNLHYSINYKSISKEKFWLSSYYEHDPVWFTKKQELASDIIIQKIDNMQHSQLTGSAVALFTSSISKLLDKRVVNGAIEINDESSQFGQSTIGYGYMEKYDLPDISDVDDKTNIAFYLVPEDAGWDITDNMEEVCDTNGVPVSTGFGYHVHIIDPNEKTAPGEAKRIYYAYTKKVPLGLDWVGGSIRAEDGEKYYFGDIYTEPHQRIYENQKYYVNDHSRYWDYKHVVPIFYPNGGITLDYIIRSNFKFHWGAYQHGYSASEGLYLQDQIVIMDKKHADDKVVEFQFSVGK